MPTPALDSVDVSWEGGATLAASPLLDGADVTWFAPTSSQTIEVDSFRIRVGGGVLVELRERTAQVLRPKSFRLSYGAHTLTQQANDPLAAIRVRAGPRMSSERPTLTFRVRHEVRDAGGAHLSYGVPAVSMNIQASSAALSYGQPALVLAVDSVTSITLTVGGGHTLRHNIRAWPTNVLHYGVPRLQKGSPHP